MSINNHYDVVFVGWGASACILMIEMDKQSLLSKKNILIIDPSDKQENDKTFCFWSKQEDEIYQNYKNIISKSWSSIQINDNKSFLINPADLNITNKNKENLKGKNAEYNAQKIVDIFKGADNEFSDSVALNAAAGLVISNKEKNFKKAYDISKQHLKSCKVFDHLQKIQAI